MIRFSLAALVVGSAALLAGCGDGDRDGASTASGQVTAPATGSTVSQTSEAPPDGDRGFQAQPCRAADVEAMIAPGEGPGPDRWHTAIVVTNKGPAPCTLQGASELEFFTGGNGSPLGIKEVTTDSAAEPVQVQVGEQASMSIGYATVHDNPPPDCLTDGSFAQVTLPGDTEPVDAWPAERQAGLPPVCGAVEVTAWAAGGAPGVPPN